MRLILRDYIATENGKFIWINLKDQIKFSDDDLLQIKINGVIKWEMNAWILNDVKERFYIPHVEYKQGDRILITWHSKMELNFS